MKPGRMEAKGKTRERLLHRISDLVDETGIFAVFAHEEPDGDAIGCQVGLALALRSLGKEVIALRTEDFPPTLNFLNEGHIVEKFEPRRHAEALARVEAVILADCCDFYRLGRLEKVVRDLNGPVVNIDHHRDNSFFGDLNYVRFEAGGAAELVFEVIRALGVLPAGRIAEALYVGISTDTVNFRYIDPEGNMIAVLGELVRGGIDVEHLQERLYCSNRASYLEDLHELLQSVNYENNGGLAWFTLFPSEHLSFYQRELASEALKQLLSVRRVRAAVMMHEEAAGVEVWLRSKRDVDVGTAAVKLGGGGHRTASGALLRGAKIAEAIPRVLNEVLPRLEDSA